jgi:hypothetical protein
LSVTPATSNQTVCAKTVAALFHVILTELRRAIFVTETVIGVLSGHVRRVRSSISARTDQSRTLLRSDTKAVRNSSVARARAAARASSLAACSAIAGPPASIRRLPANTAMATQVFIEL